jgi:hypothetical protein
MEVPSFSTSERNWLVVVLLVLVEVVVVVMVAVASSNAIMSDNILKVVVMIFLSKAMADSINKMVQ